MVGKCDIICSVCLFYPTCYIYSHSSHVCWLVGSSDII